MYNIDRLIYLRDRLMVGQRTLNPFILVQIQVPQNQVLYILKFSIVIFVIQINLIYCTNLFSKFVEGLKKL